jgi:thiol-disulfide isomerase/thioredoxin
MPCRAVALGINTIAGPYTCSMPHPSTSPQNSLANSASAYLRSAMHQPIQWHEWGPEAFAKARAQDKPILLDIGAVWCHWCHVMDRESYENPATAALINEHFIAVKVDRDERPDVASDRHPDLGRTAVLRRHVFSAGRPLWPPRFSSRIGDAGRRVA